MEKTKRPLVKVAITSESFDVLGRLVVAANDGFSAGKISKTDLLSWVIDRYEVKHFSDALGDIRRDHFDQVAFLERFLADVKLAKRQGEISPDFSSLVSQISSTTGKSTK